MAFARSLSYGARVGRPPALVGTTYGSYRHERILYVVTHPSAEFLDLQAALAGEYSLQRELGRGGMGVVYLARDVQLDRDVAIKVLPAHLARDPEARDRF